MAIIKRAAAEVNSGLNLFKAVQVGDEIISGDAIARAIMKAADEVISGRWDDQFVVDPIQAGAGTSHNMNVNEVIANRANEILGYELSAPIKPVHPNDHVNMAQSTNDTIPTAIRLGCIWRLDELLLTLDALVETLDLKTAEFDGIVKSGRTHLQDAVPVRLGQEFGRLFPLYRKESPEDRLGSRKLTLAWHRRHRHRHRFERTPPVSSPHDNYPQYPIKPFASRI